MQNQISITQFFENKSVFITGATGFIGRILVEKLLRSCDGIKNIYVLIRPKKGKSVKERINNIFDIPLFDKLRLENKVALEKIVPIKGDMQELGFGISKENLQTIIDNVTIIFHNAACVKFDKNLKTMILTNVRSTREAILLAKKLKKIDVFVDTSTAFCNSDVISVKEELYPPKWDWRDIITVAEECDDRLMEIMSHKCVEPLPNTYILTKSIAEHVIADLSKGCVPAVIVRPTIVITTHDDPITGWIDNYNGPSGILYGIAMGVTRSLYLFKQTYYDNVFADNVVKALIISAWKKAMSPNMNAVDIYNAASDFNFNPTQMRDFGLSFTSKYPLEQQIWPSYVRCVDSYIIFYILTIIYHLLPAILLDGILRFNGKKPRLWRVQRRTFIANMTLVYFLKHVWKFENSNYLGLRNILLKEDVKSFNFKHYGCIPNDNDLKTQMNNFYAGCRCYLTEEGPPTEKAFRKQKRKLLIERIWFTLLGLLFLYCLFFKFQLLPVLTDYIKQFK